ncbi:MAG: divergent polysaccharide deacetylase family protein [Roseobacter sp.]
MANGYLKGALWGTVASTAGLACLSVLSDLPQAPTVTALAPVGAPPPGVIVNDAQRSAADRAPVTTQQVPRTPAPTPDTLQQVESGVTQSVSQPSVGAASVLRDDQALSDPAAPDALPQLPSGQAVPATQNARGLQAPDAASAPDIAIVTERPAPAIVAAAPPADAAAPQRPEAAAPARPERQASEETALSISVDPVQPAAPPVPDSGQAFAMASQEPDATSLFEAPDPEPGALQAVLGDIAAAVAPETPLQTAPQDFANVPLPDADSALAMPLPAPVRRTPAPAAATLSPAKNTAPEAPSAIASTAPRANTDAPSQPVRINRLPTLGEDAQSQPQVSTPRRAPATGVGSPSDRTPFEVFAAPLEGLPDKPRLAVVLMDDGVDLSGEVIGLAALRSFPYPVSFAIDPLLPDATERMRAYRAAGFEILATVDFPEGAKAQDAEVTLTATLETMPEVFAILEGAGTGVQTTREAADYVTAFLADSGHGFLAQNRGLNTVQKLAARSGVPSAVVFRDFDKLEQSPRTIRRFLDNAAFRAGREGDVVMLGRLRPDTLSALLLWGLEDRADRVALVPVSNILRAQP